jgi:hypothetical protein
VSQPVFATKTNFIVFGVTLTMARTKIYTPEASTLTITPPTLFNTGEIGKIIIGDK